MTVDQVIQECRIDDGIVFLPEVQLDRKTYQGVAKKLQGIGGKWNRKSKGFVFSSDPSELLGRVKEGENINLKKQFQFFETPGNVQLIMQDYISSPNLEALEPSAGKGALIGRLPKKYNVTYCELNPECVKSIEEQDFPDTEFAAFDFMDYSTDNKFGLVFANPPFTKGQYCDHIIKMFDHLVSGGRIVTVAPIGFTFAKNGKQKKFKEWLETKEHIIIDLPENAFKSSGTMVKTCVIIIDNN